MNAIVQIAPASRAGAHLLVQVFGGPQCGKTMSALLLARGIAGPSGKVGCLDTESGRAKFFADKIPGGFFHADLSPPFTADRYRQAIEEFVKFGTDVLVIDSFSHVWNGPGGVLEQADTGEANGKKGLQKWLRPKVEYRKLIGFLLSTRIHIIFCSRGKQPVEERTVNGKKEFVTLPWEPIQDKMLKFEMTVVLPMIMNGSFETDPNRLKTPGDIKHLFTGQPITVETGKMIADWVGGAPSINHAHELLRKHANDAAMEGVNAFRDFWKGLGKGDRTVLQPNLANYQSIAKTADEDRTQNGGGQDDPPDDPFSDAAAGQGDAGTTITDAGTGEIVTPPPAVTPLPIPQRPEGGPDWPAFFAAASEHIRQAPSAEYIAAWVAANADSIRALGTAKKTWPSELEHVGKLRAAELGQSEGAGK
jgi:hypothetical protein